MNVSWENVGDKEEMLAATALSLVEFKLNFEFPEKYIKMQKQLEINENET